MPGSPTLKRRAFWVLASLCAAAAFTANAQAPQQPQAPPAATVSPNSAPQPAAPVPTKAVGEKAAPATPAPTPAPVNEAVQQSDQLLKMANDLWNAVDKSTKDTLSVSVIRKAEAIEHFAHDVRVKTNPEVGSK